MARAAGAPVYFVHVSCRAALDEVGRARAAGQHVFAETCPHFLTLDESCYDAPSDEECLQYVISPPLRAPADRDALWVALRDGGLDLVATDHVPDRLAVDQQRRAGHRDAARDRVLGGRSARAHQR
jgi:dihydropyrimidinase